MVGRATFGHPWIFQEMKCYLEQGEIMPTPSMRWQIDILKEHVDRSIEWLDDERKGIVHSRRHFAASPVFKGLPDFKQTRIQLLRTENRNDLFRLMDEIVERYETNA